MNIKVCYKSEEKEIEVKDIKPLSINNNLMIVLQGRETKDTKYDCITYQFYRVQYMAICLTDKFGFINVAFYLGDYGAIEHVVLDDLFGDYTPTKSAYLIDFESYNQICKLTGEKAMSFMEYVEAQMSDHMTYNYLLKYNDKFFDWSTAYDLLNPE